jgi:hypothetical protein
VSYDLNYLRGETCCVKWTVDSGPMPSQTSSLRACGKPAVAGVGMTRTGEFLHPSDPRVLGDFFFCQEHLAGALKSGLDESKGEIAVKVPKNVN